MENGVLEQVNLVRIEDQVSCELKGEAVVLNLESGMYYGLNEVGLFVWNLLQSSTTMDDLMTAVLAEYRVEPDLCRQDLLALLQALVEAGLVQVQDQKIGV